MNKEDEKVHLMIGRGSSKLLLRYLAIMEIVTTSAGRQTPNGKVEVINNLYGDEALAQYKKLMTERQEENK